MSAPIVMTAAMIAAATGGSVIAGAADQVVLGVSIDSRSLAPGDMFVAIVAARDGHEFVGAALARGACGAIVDARYQPSDRDASDAAIVRVGDTTKALQDLARSVRRQSGAKVVAITGSAGKTTTKEATASFLAVRYQVTHNKGNLNNHLGLPLSLLELRHGAEVAVAELGMNHAGEIRELVGIADPEIRVWTNVGDAHLGHFASREAIAEAKAEILEAARPTDLLVYNADDPLVSERTHRFAGRTMGFGLSATASVRAAAIEERGLDGSHFVLHTPTGSIAIDCPLIGSGNLLNVLAAAAVATHLGIGLPDVADRASRLAAAPHRGAVVRLAGGVTLLDDSYNSSPAALARVLEVVAREQRFARKAAVLGEMLELGAHSRQLHEQCGRLAAAAGLSRLIAVGGDSARVLADAAVTAGLAPDDVAWCSTSDEAASLLVSWLRADDLLLVKGSHGIKTDRVVDRITEAFS